VQDALDQIDDGADLLRTRATDLEARATSLENETAKLSTQVHRIYDMVQGWDTVTSTDRARFCIVTPATGIVEAKLWIYAEYAVTDKSVTTVTYDRTTSVDVGNINTTAAGGGVETAASTTYTATTGGPSAVGYAENSMAATATTGTQNGTNTHTHSVSITVNKIFQHDHTASVTNTPTNLTEGAGLTTSSPGISRSTTALPSSAALYIDDNPITVTWDAASPTSDKQLMLNGADITSYIATEGTHWIEVDSAADGKIRFVLRLAYND
jgi:hypothetical protein